MLDEEIDLEFEASKAYHERTGKQWRWLSNTQRRNEIEKYQEEHQCSS